MIRMISDAGQVAEFETAEELFMFQDIMVETSGDFECTLDADDYETYCAFGELHNSHLTWKQEMCK